jgi:hypothetical protein
LPSRRRQYAAIAGAADRNACSTPSSSEELAAIPKHRHISSVNKHGSQQDAGTIGASRDVGEVMTDRRPPSALHAIYKLQDQVSSVLRSAGVAVIDVRVDEGRRQVAIELDADLVEEVTRVLRNLPERLIILRPRRTPHEPTEQ